ncbi:MAG: YkgJ family cysteine cluster protein, partial [Rhodospirillales bacterium]|nr:YkgJ family cysteine cluster protein [Rhodospirillales bacterium]
TDIRKAADFLNTSPAEFKKVFLKRDGNSWVLEVGEEGAPCAFLTDQGCGIHPAKPKQCESYPFWKENMDSKPMWRLVGGFCPGIDIGPMVPVGTIKSFLKKFTR